MRDVQPERLYTQVLGVVLLILGIIGLLVGERVTYFNFELPEDLLHVILGAAGVYLGFFTPELRFDRIYAQVTGVIFLLMGIVGMIDPTVYGVFRLGLTPLDHTVHLLIGGIGLTVGFFYNTERRGALGHLGGRI